jgi:hypothetical protein
MAKTEAFVAAVAVPQHILDPFQNPETQKAAQTAAVK